MRLFAALLLMCALISCRPADADHSADDRFASEEYTAEAIPDTELKQVVKYNDEGRLLEKGLVLNGLAEGAWSYYEQSNEFPKRIINYHRGRVQGLYLEFSERGQIVLKANYFNNELHGDWVAYELGLPVRTATYINGQLHGIYREYDRMSGTLQKAIHYQNGQLHGPYRYYDQSGEISLEYMYEQGQRVDVPEGEAAAATDTVEDTK